MSSIKFSASYLLMSIFFLSITAFGEEDKKPYIYIEADKLINKQEILVSEFIGNVYANDGENYFWGDKMIINYDENKKIDQIIIEENVKIKRIFEEATGNFASYKPKDGIIELTGDVVVFKDDSVLYGEKLTVDLISSSSIISGNSQKQVSVKIVQ